MLWTLEPTACGRQEASPEAHGCWGSEGLRWLSGVLGCYYPNRRAAPDPGSGEPPAWSADEPRRSGPPVTGKQSAGLSNFAVNGRVVPAAGQPGHGEFTASLRRQRVPPGRLEDGYTGAFEVICGDCGDHPYLGYSQVSPRLQRLRGPYNTIKAGLAAYQEHLGLAS